MIHTPGRVWEVSHCDTHTHTHRHTHRHTHTHCSWPLASTSVTTDRCSVTATLHECAWIKWVRTPSLDRRTLCCTTRSMMQLNIWQTKTGDVSSPGEPKYPGIPRVIMHCPNTRWEMCLRRRRLKRKPTIASLSQTNSGTRATQITYNQARQCSANCVFLLLWMEISILR